MSNQPQLTLKCVKSHNGGFFTKGECYTGFRRLSNPMPYLVTTYDGPEAIMIELSDLSPYFEVVSSEDDPKVLKNKPQTGRDYVTGYCQALTDLKDILLDDLDNIAEPEASFIKSCIYLNISSLKSKVILNAYEELCKQLNNE